jgi:hypothetical protein
LKASRPQPQQYIITASGNAKIKKLIGTIQTVVVRIATFDGKTIAIVESNNNKRRKLACPGHKLATIQCIFTDMSQTSGLKYMIVRNPIRFSNSMSG